jgi:hypothetical protein
VGQLFVLVVHKVAFVDEDDVNVPNVVGSFLDRLDASKRDWLA